MKEVLRGGRVWFAVESKSFEILIDEVGGKLRGCIWERSKGITSWIRFGDVSLVGCWLELSFVAEVEMKKAGPMLGRRRIGVTGWRNV